VYSFQLDETDESSSVTVTHTYWRVLLVRTNDGHILVVTFEIDPRDPKALNYFGTSTYEWADRVGWDFSEAFRHRDRRAPDDTQYLQTYQDVDGIRGLYKVENHKKNINITSVPFKVDSKPLLAGAAYGPGLVSVPGRNWTHHAIIL